MASVPHEVFIPFDGEATIDHDFHAKARLDGRDDVSAARVTISVVGSDSARTEHHGVGSGDTFPWGSYRAFVVRVVEPQDGRLGAIGWIQIKLSPGALDAGVRGESHRDAGRENAR